MTPPEIDSIDRSVPRCVKALGLLWLFMLGAGVGVIGGIMACQWGWVPK